jgi:ABC-type polysaccharide/polyol phosphate export permease
LNIDKKIEKYSTPNKDANQINTLNYYYLICHLVRFDFIVRYKGSVLDVLWSLMFLFYLTPVFYQSQAVVEKFRILYTLNPIAVLIQSYRAIFFYGVAPDLVSLLFVGATSVVVCGLGYLLYSRRLHDVIDTI